MKKILLSVASFSVTIVPVATIISCGSSLETYATKEKIAADEGVKALKEKFPVSKLDTSKKMIFFNKQEVAKQFEKVVKLFNDEFGTNLYATVIGGETSSDTVLGPKFAAASHDILLASTVGVPGFVKYEGNFVDTKASDFLDKEGLADLGAIPLTTSKTTMSTASEGFGLLYNKEKMKEWGIEVKEGETNSSGTGWVPSTSGGTIYSDSLTLNDYKEINTYLENKNVIPFYPVSKTGEGNIWPMTNHLYGVTLTENYDEEAATKPIEDLTANDFEYIMSDQIIDVLKDALDIYGQDKEYNKTTNTNDTGVIGVATGAHAFYQNGTWNASSMSEASEDEVGILPMPIIGTDGTAVVSKTISQHWLATDLTNETNSKNTAKLFLQFLYTTKIGHEIQINDFSFGSPFTQAEMGFTGDIIGDGNQLLASMGNYSSATVVSSASDGLLPQPFNNKVESFRQAFENGFSDSSDYDKMEASWKKLFGV